MSSNFKILFPDNLHYHKNNFKSLLNWIIKNRVDTLYVNDNDVLKKLSGNYHQYKSFFLEEYDILKKMSYDELFDFKYLGINIFGIAKAEMLSYLISLSNWYSEKIDFNKRVIFDKATKENYEDLLLNMAAALFWLKFWHKKLSSFKDVNVCIMFSGSLIYVKSLNNLLQNTPIRVFVVEHFFTGNDYYLEEKYEHIANNSDIRFNTVYNKKRYELFNNNSIYIDNERIKALNKIKLMNNKNVKQPKSKQLIDFKNKKENILILGQVINDFSILETNLTNINSLSIYKELISKILIETDYNIIFKAHPWEKNKVNIGRSFTKDELYTFINKEFPNEFKRVYIVEDYNLYALFNLSKYIISICSQSLIEAGLSGKKTFQLGKAFFGEKGFTYDIDNVNDFIKYVNSNTQSLLSLDEYNRLLDFLTVILQNHLVSIHPSGESFISKVFSFRAPVKSINRKENNLIEEDRIINKIIENIVYFVATKEKTRKIKKNPRKYFRDAKHPLIRILAKFYR